MFGCVWLDRVGGCVVPGHLLGCAWCVRRGDLGPVLAVLRAYVACCQYSIRFGWKITGVWWGCLRRDTQTAAGRQVTLRVYVCGLESDCCCTPRRVAGLAGSALVSHACRVQAVS